MVLGKFLDLNKPSFPGAEFSFGAAFNSDVELNKLSFIDSINRQTPKMTTSCDDQYINHCSPRQTSSFIADAEFANRKRKTPISKGSQVSKQVLRRSSEATDTLGCLRKMLTNQSSNRRGDEHKAKWCCSETWQLKFTAVSLLWSLTLRFIRPLKTKRAKCSSDHRNLSFSETCGVSPTWNGIVLRL